MDIVLKCSCAELEKHHENGLGSSYRFETGNHYYKHFVMPKRQSHSIHAEVAYNSTRGPHLSPFSTTKAISLWIQWIPLPYAGATTAPIAC